MVSPSISTFVLVRRSREGAWIEIIQGYINALENYLFAPVRERGLKFLPKWRLWATRRRSREGAWIEIRQAAH